MRASVLLSLLLVPCVGCLSTSGVRSSPTLEVSVRDKTDTVELRNGDRITCEIKALQRGRLIVKTDSMSKLTIEWDDVARIQSKHVFRVETSDGLAHYGTLVRTDSPRTVGVGGEGPLRTFPMSVVVRIDPLEDTLVGRFDGYAKFGFSYTKASEVSQSSFGGGFVFLGRTDRVSLDVSAIVTTQEGRADTRNVDSTLGYRRLLDDRWFTFVSAGIQRSDELGIDLRSSVGAGGGRALLQSNTMMWSIAAGLVANKEEADGGGGETNLESELGTEFSIFDFDEPSTDLTLKVMYYLNVDNFDRSRIDSDLRLRKEIIKDLFFEIALFVNYDSDPPSATASHSDFGVVTSVGYTF